jgi:hypothetical protein
MMRPSFLVYAVLIAGILFALLSLNEEPGEPSATVAPDLRQGQT